MKHSEKIIVIAQAIKVHYWKELYLTLSKEDVPFEMVFVGHIKPNFALPLNFTWIDCSLSPAKCAEIAYRYSYKHFPDAKYIVNIADDLLLPPNFLRDNKIFYNRQKEKLSKYKNIDKVFLDKLWITTADEVDGKITNCCVLNNQNKNENFQKKMLIKRKEEVKEYTTEELQGYYE